MNYQDVKVGDKWLSANYLDHYKEHTVTKVTKTQIVLSNGTRISRASGRVVGVEGYSTIIRYFPYTKEFVDQSNAKAEYSQLRNEVSDTLERLNLEARRRNLTVDQLKTIQAALKGF